VDGRADSRLYDLLPLCQREDRAIESYLDVGCAEGAITAPLGKGNVVLV